MTPVTAPPPVSRRRWLLLSAAAVGLVLLWAAVATSVLSWVVGGPAFTTLTDVPADQVTAVDAFVLNRPDGGPDIGSPRELKRLADPKPVLAWLANAKPVPYQRSILLGRLVIRLEDGRAQELILNQVKDTTDPTGRRFFVRYHIERNTFDAGPADEFTRLLGSE